MRGTGFGFARRIGSPFLGARIVLSAASIAESASVGSVVGALSVAKGSGSYTFTKTADPDGKFAINAGNLETAAALDYELSTWHRVTVQADNGVDPPISREFIISVTNVFEQPDLGALSLPALIAQGATVSISGATPGSTITAPILPAGWTLDSPNRQILIGVAAPLGEQSWSLLESLADASNSPRATNGASVIEAASEPPTPGRTLADLEYSRLLVGGREAGDDVPDRYWLGVIEQQAAMNFEIMSGAT